MSVTAGGIIAASEKLGWAVNLRVPSAKVASDLTSFVTKVNLADMDDTWWELCDGENIRVHTAAGMPVPFDPVGVDIGAQTGTLYLKANLLTASNNDFLISVRPGMSALAATHTYGRNAVWSDYDFYCDFLEWVDRTGQGHDPVMVGTSLTYYTASQEIASSLFQQGVAWDGSDWYGTGGASNLRMARVDGTTETEEVSVSDTSAAADLVGGSTYNHLAGCVIHNAGSGNELYTLGDAYPSTADQVCQVWNPSTLAFVREYTLDDTRPEDVNSDICWNDDDNEFVMSDFDDSLKLHRWSQTFTYLGDLTLPTPINSMQGITWAGGYYFIMAGPLGASSISRLWKVKDDMTTAVQLWSGSAHNQGIVCKNNATEWPDLWFGDSSGDLIKLTYTSPSSTPVEGWLNITGSGNAEVTNLHKYTTWTTGVSAKLSTQPSSNNGVLGYSDYSSSDTNRTNIVARDAPDQWALWQNGDTWLSGPSIGAGDLGGVTRRLNHVHNTTANRKLYFNGALYATDTTVAQKPGGGTDGTMALFIGCGDKDYTERFKGALNYVYLRNGALSDNWLAAEQLSWNGSSFYSII